MLMAMMTVMLLFPTFGIAGEGLHRSRVEEIRILKIAPLEGKAVIQFGDGSFRLVKIGDEIYQGARVSEIAEGRIVVEETSEKGLETFIIRVKDGKQSIEGFRKVIEREPIPTIPK